MSDKIDFAFSEDGDLILGLPKLNDGGKILYRHKDGTMDTIQYRGTEKGKEVLDLAYTRGKDAVQQIVMNRLKTEAPDWYHHPSMGGNLTDLIGEQNTKETAMLGVNYIMDALTYGGLFSASQVGIRPVPVNAEEILFSITIQLDGNEPYRLPLVFNLNHGLKEV